MFTLARTSHSLTPVLLDLPTMSQDLVLFRSNFPNPLAPLPPPLPLLPTPSVDGPASAAGGTADLTADKVGPYKRLCTLPYPTGLWANI